MDAMKQADAQIAACKEEAAQAKADADTLAWARARRAAAEASKAQDASPALAADAEGLRHRGSSRTTA